MRKTIEGLRAALAGAEGAAAQKGTEAKILEAEVQRLKEDIRDKARREEPDAVSIREEFSPGAGFEAFEKVARKKWPLTAYKRVLEVKGALTNQDEVDNVACLMAVDRKTTAEAAEILRRRMGSPEQVLRGRIKETGKVISLVSAITALGGDEEESSTCRTAHLLVSRERGEAKIEREALYRCISGLKEALVRGGADKVSIPNPGVEWEDWLAIKKMCEWTFSDTSIVVTLHLGKREPREKAPARAKPMQGGQTWRQVDAEETPLNLHEVGSGAWTTVGGTERTKRQEPPRVKTKASREDTVIVRTGDVSYAEMIKKIKGGINLQATGVGVQKIMRTMNGDLRLGLEKGHKGAEPLITALKEVVGEGKASLSRTRTVLTVRHMDETTTLEELKEAVATALGEKHAGIEVRKLRLVYSGTQVAKLIASEEQARILLKPGHLRVVWSSVRIRERMEEDQE